MANNNVPSAPGGGSAPSAPGGGNGGNENGNNGNNSALAGARAARNQQAANMFGNTNLQQAQNQYMINMRSYSNNNQQNDNDSIFWGRVQLNSGAKEKFVKVNESLGGQTLAIARNNLIPKGEAGKGARIMLTGATALFTIGPIHVISRQAQKGQYKADMDKYISDIISNNPVLQRKQSLQMTRTGQLASNGNTNISKVKFSKLERALLKKDYKTITNLEISSINQVLKAHGYRTIPGGIRGKDLEKFCDKNIKKIKKSGANVPKDVMDALKNGKALGAASKYANTNKHAVLKGQLRQALYTLLNNSGEGSKGLIIVVDVTTKSTKTIRFSVKNTQKLARMGRNSIQKAIISLIERQKDLSTQISNRRYARAVNRSGRAHIQSMRSGGNQSQRFQRKAQKNSQKAQKLNNKINSKSCVKPKLSQKMKGGLSNLRSGLARRFGNTRTGSAVNRIRGRFGTFNNRVKAFKGRIKRGFDRTVIGRLKNSVRKVLAKILDPFRIVWAKIKFILGVTIGSYAGLYILIVIITGVCGVFDFANATKKEVVCGYLQNVYQNDLKYMVYVYQGYNIEFKDVRDQASYDKHMSGNTEQTDSSTTTTEKTSETNTTEDDSEKSVWLQSSNCAEILTMMYVDFDYDIDSDNYDEDVLKDYVEGLYYGSHEISINDSTRTVTFTTYYFDSLFTRGSGDGVELTEAELNMVDNNYWQDGMKHSPVVQRLINTAKLNNVEKEVYEALKKAGFSTMAAVAVMGNIYAESGFDSKTIGSNSNNAYGLFQFDPGASGSWEYPSLGSSMDGYLKFLGVEGKNLNKKDTPAKQVEFALNKFGNEFNSYTGTSTVHSYVLGDITDTSQYHVWCMRSYSLDDFKAWDETTIADEGILKDFITHGDTNMGSGAAVKSYLDGLNKKELAVANATILFTKVYEKAGTHDWISQRVKKAIEYYHYIGGGFSGGIRTAEENPLTWDAITNDSEIHKWYSGHNGGVSPFMGDIGLDKNNGDRGGNCVAYAWSRRAEMEGGTELGTNGDAFRWYDREVNAGIYRCSNTDPPQPGAVVVWDYGTGANGHVAVVEQVNDDGSIVISDSKYGSQDNTPELFRSWTFSSEAELRTWAGSFVGYIYIDKIK